MRFSQDTASHGYTIHSVTSGGVTVRSPQGGEMVLQRSLIIGAEHLITDWEPRTPEQLRPDHFAAIMAMKPEVLLLGTGSRICFPAPALFAPLMEAGIGWEVMDNAAAGRTYNVLNGDGRQVVAALLIP